MSTVKRVLKKLYIHKLARPVVQQALGTITHFVTKEPVVALTFDDGPHPKYTPRLLDVLAKYNARATFFMLGESAQRYPHIVKAVAEQGHAIGNHSWDHPSFPLVERSERRKQIRLCREILSPYGGQHLFRPPFGHQNWSSMLDVRLMGYETVAWNVNGKDCLDYEGLWIADLIESKISPGCIILLHDALHDYFDERYLDRTPTLEAVDLLLRRLNDRIKFITIPEMLKVGKPQRRIRIVQRDFNWFDRLKTAPYEAGKYENI